MRNTRRAKRISKCATRLAAGVLIAERCAPQAFFGGDLIWRERFLATYVSDFYSIRFELQISIFRSETRIGLLMQYDSAKSDGPKSVLRIRRTDPSDFDCGAFLCRRRFFGGGLFFRDFFLAT